jgi:hypothetical protein
MLKVPLRTSGRSPPSQPMLLVLARCRSVPGSPLGGRNQPALSSPPYVANVCSSVLGVITGMLQVFHMDVVKVDRDVAYVASVSEAC